MSYTSDRAEFTARIGLALAQGDTPPPSAYYAAAVAAKLMRYASTLQRLAAAQCNGDWPADNGTRPTAECPLCGTRWARVAICGGKLAVAAWDHDCDPCAEVPTHRRACPDCRTAAAVRELVRESLPMFQPVFTGDPRGYVVRLAPAAATREDIDSGRAPIVYVPGRE